MDRLEYEFTTMPRAGALVRGFLSIGILRSRSLSSRLFWAA